MYLLFAAVDKGAAAVVDVEATTVEAGGRSKKDVDVETGVVRNELIQRTGGCGGGCGGRTNVGGVTDGFSEEVRAEEVVGELWNPGGGSPFFSVMLI